MFTRKSRITGLRAIVPFTRNTIGYFESVFTLSGDFDGTEKIEANLTNGVFRLTVPRAAQAEARTIKIAAGG